MQIIVRLSRVCETLSSLVRCCINSGDFQTMLIGGTKMTNADLPCEQSELATENRKFTVPEEILNFLDMGYEQYIFVSKYTNTASN